MDRKEVIVEGFYWLLSTISGVCAFGMGVALHLQHLSEPNIMIRTVETVLFMSSGIILCTWSFIRLWRKHDEYIKEKISERQVI